MPGRVLVVVVGVGRAERWFVSPRVAAAVLPSGRSLPLFFRRQAASRPGAVRRRLVPTHTHYRPVRMLLLLLPISGGIKFAVAFFGPVFSGSVAAVVCECFVFLHCHGIAPNAEGT